MPNIFGLDLSPLLDGIKTAVGGMVGESSAQPRDPFQGYQPQGTDPFAGLTYTGSSGNYQPQGHDPFAGWQGGGSDPFAGLSYGTMGSTFASNDPNQSFGANPLFAAFDQARQNKLGFLASEEAKKATIGKGVVVGAGVAGGGTMGAGFGNPTTDQVEAQLAGSPLAGHGQAIASYAQQYGVPVSVALAIFRQESSYGRAPAQGTTYNFGGLTGGGPNGRFQDFPDVDSGIKAVIANMGTNPVYRGKSLRDFMLTYAPPGDGNDTDAYIGNIVALVHQLGGTADANSIVVGAPQQAPKAGSGGMMASIWGGGNAPINQDYGVVDPSVDQSIYSYGAAYGLPQGHTGIDVGIARGTQLYSPVAGTVVTAGGTPYFRDEDYGDSGTPGKGELKIRLDNGDEIILGHTSSIGVQAGQRINAGDFVGLSGSASGDHLHLEVRQKQPDGSYRLVAPQEYFGGR